MLAERLVAIAESSLAQTEARPTVRRSPARWATIRSSSCCARRSRGTTNAHRDPAAGGAGHLALRLKQLLNIPYGEPLALTSDIEDQTLAPVTLVANTTLRGATPDTSAEARASVRQQQESLLPNEAELQIARSEGSRR